MVNNAETVVHINGEIASPIYVGIAFNNGIPSEPHKDFNGKFKELWVNGELRLNNDVSEAN